MARKISKKDNRYLAKLVTGERAPCAFCLREVDDEVTYGKLYAIGDIQCHYFCCLLSCCLIQKGNDEEGLFGFMYSDILAEVERCKKHKCSYCGRSGANLGCSVGACRKQFHVPCGRNKNAVSLYYGSYKSFCQQHAPKQKIPEHIMAKARLRMKVDRIKRKHVIAANMKQDYECDVREEMVCLICYEAVEGFPTVNTFWPPCCGKDAWFHRTCLQRMALSAGMHYLKCPLCNDKERFYDAVVDQGYYVPDRDAAWELEQNAFAEIYERPATCSAEPCLCPLGRSHDAENGKWDIKLCLLCGSAGAHAHCITDLSQPSKRDALSLDQSEKITEITTLTDQLPSKELRNLSTEAIESTNEDTLSMDQLNTTPIQTNISPDQSNTDRSNTCFGPSHTSDQSNTYPAQSNTHSDQSNTDRSNTCFDQSNTSDQSNTYPAQSNTSPDKSNTSVRFVCRSCLPAAPEDLNALASSIEAIIQQEQMQSTTEARPVMPSRMSIRRTKGRRAVIDRASSSRSNYRTKTDKVSSESPNVVSSRLELNLKPPRRLHTDPVVRDGNVESKLLLSPLKLLEQSFREKMVCAGVRDAVLDDAVVDILRRKFRKPRPMCERKRIVNDILDGVFDDLLKGSKQKDQVKEWCSPKKCFNPIEDSKELQYEFSDTTKEDKGQEKENDSNMSNTPSMDPRNNKVEGVISNLMNTDENIKSVKHQNKLDNFINSDVKQNEIKIEESLVNNTTEHCNLYKNDTNTQCDTEIEENSRKNSEDNCKKESNSISEADIKNISENFTENNTNTIESSTKNSSESCRKIRNSTKILQNSGDSNEGNNNDINSNTIEAESKINETPKNEVSCRMLNKSISESFVTENSKDIVETDDSKTKTQKDDSEKEQINVENKKGKLNKKPSSRKRKRSRRGNRKLKGVQKPKHFAIKNEPFKDKPKVRSKSESSTDIHILKRLLTEKDLCSQLLLELTTGKANRKKFANSNLTDTKINDVQYNTTETPKLINDTSKYLHEIPKESMTSKSNTQKRSITKNSETPKASRKTPKNLAANGLKTTKNSVKSSNTLERTRTELNERNSAPRNSDKNIHLNKTRKDSDYSPKSVKKIQNDINQRNSTPKDTNKTTISNKTTKDSNKNPKSQGSPKSSDQTQSLTKYPINLDDLNNLIDTPKHKIIYIQQDSSLEISENNQHVNIDVIKIEDSPTTGDSYKNLKIIQPKQLKTCFKFSPTKDTLDKNDIDIDLESFKKEYLNEVDREFKCSFKHKHVEKASDERRFRSPIDFAIDAAIKKEIDPTINNKKRKLSESGVKLLFDNSFVKRRKISESCLKLGYLNEIPEKCEDIDKTSTDNKERRKTDKEKRRKKETKERRKAKKNKRKSSSDKNIEVTIDSSEKRSVKNKKIKKKIKTKFAIQNENIQVKIKWKKKQFSLNIESKKQATKEKKIKHDCSKFKQYVLQFPEGTSKEVLVKPEKRVCPLKRKYIKNEKSPDNMKQLSIQSFFKVKSER